MFIMKLGLVQHLAMQFSLSLNPLLSWHCSTLPQYSAVSVALLAASQGRYVQLTNPQNWAKAIHIPQMHALQDIHMKCTRLEQELRKSKRREEKLTALQYRLKEDVRLMGADARSLPSCLLVFGRNLLPYQLPLVLDVMLHSRGHCSTYIYA